MNEFFMSRKNHARARTKGAVHGSNPLKLIENSKEAPDAAAYDAGRTSHRAKSRAHMAKRAIRPAHRIRPHAPRPMRPVPRAMRPAPCAPPHAPRPMRPAPCAPPHAPRPMRPAPCAPPPAPRPRRERPRRHKKSLNSITRVDRYSRDRPDVSRCRHTTTSRLAGTGRG